MPVWILSKFEVSMYRLWNKLELLEELGEIPKELRDKIGKLEDITKLKILHKKAARAESISDFEKETDDYYNLEK